MGGWVGDPCVFGRKGELVWSILSTGRIYVHTWSGGVFAVWRRMERRGNCGVIAEILDGWMHGLGMSVGWEEAQAD